MTPVRPEGTTHVAGASQGYVPLPIRRELDEHGDMRIVSAWLPSAEELAALNAGAAVYLTIYGSFPPPQVMHVGAYEKV